MRRCSLIKCRPFGDAEGPLEWLPAWYVKRKLKSFEVWTTEPPKAMLGGGAGGGGGLAVQH